METNWTSTTQDSYYLLFPTQESTQAPPPLDRQPARRGDGRTPTRRRARGRLVSCHLSLAIIPLRGAGDDQVAAVSSSLGLGLPRDAAVMQVPGLLCQLQLYHPAPDRWW